MSDTAQIVVSIIGVLGIILSNMASNRKVQEDIKRMQEVYQAHTSEQIDSIKTDLRRLEQKQDKHNAVIERTYELEKASELQGAELKRHNERIRLLEGGK